MKLAKILSDRVDRHDDLVAAGETVNMVFLRGKRALSLRAGKMFHLLVKAAGADLAADKPHRLRLSEFQDTVHLSHSQIVGVIRELQQTVVEITSVVPESVADEMEIKPGQFHIIDDLREDDPLVRRTISGPLLELVDHRENRKGTVVYRFSRALRLIFDHTEHWAIISRRAVMAFESRYALRLFELISLRINLERKTSELFNLDELRAHFGVPEDKLVLWGHFRTRALDPAIAEVNHIAGFKVSYEPIKHSRSVTGVKISWKVKDPDGLKAAKVELDTHSAGRRARREGAVETVSVPTALPPGLIAFPASGSILYGPWAEIARQELPQPRRDIDLVANEFRTWAASKSMPLDGSAIEKTFRGFCRKVKPAS